MSATAVPAAARPWAVLLLAAGIAAALVAAAPWLGGRMPPPASATGARWLEAGLSFLVFGLLGAAGLAGRRLMALGGDWGGAPAAGLGAAVGLVALLAALADAWLAGIAHPGGSAGAGAAALLLGTATVVVQAGAEELFFRGWLQRALARDWPRPVALAAAAILFALLHILGGARAPLAIGNILLAGLLFGLLLERTGTLAAPLAAHIGYNWAETLLFGLDPNPGTGSFGAVWNLDLTGAALWGGSAEGLNASLGLSFALAACLVPLAAGWVPVLRLRVGPRG